jgi:hypothetical protein
LPDVDVMWVSHMPLGLRFLTVVVLMAVSTVLLVVPWPTVIQTTDKTFVVPKLPLPPNVGPVTPEALAAAKRERAVIAAELGDRMDARIQAAAQLAEEINRPMPPVSDGPVVARGPNPAEEQRLTKLLSAAEHAENETALRLKQADDRIQAIELRLAADKAKMGVLLDFFTSTVVRLDEHDRAIVSRLEEMRRVSEANAASLIWTVDVVSKLIGIIGVFSALALGWKDQIRRPRWPWRVKAAETAPADSSKD